MTNMMVYFGSNARRSCSERNVGDCQREFVHHVAARDPTLERAGCGLVTPTATTPTPTESVERKSIHSFKRRARYLAPQPFPLCPSTFNACVALKYPQITSPALHSRTSFDTHIHLEPTNSDMSLAINTNRPLVSSPLASPLSPSRQPSRPLSIKNPSFPASRPLRPFPSIMTATMNGSTRGATKKPVKIIEPPKGYSGGCFVLNLTQAELSRRD